MAVMTSGTYTVGEVAALAHVSVRTLHHYAAVGLLVPGGRTRRGYRTCSATDLQRLRQIRYYRALEFGLDDIAALLVDPGATAEDHLRRQHRVLHQAGLAATEAGVGQASPEARALAEAHRLFLDRWFYDCGDDMHRGLPDMYLADERFRRTYDRVAPGPAQYVHDAIPANADTR